MSRYKFLNRHKNNLSSPDILQTQKWLHWDITRDHGFLQNFEPRHKICLFPQNFVEFNTGRQLPVVTLLVCWQLLNLLTDSLILNYLTVNVWLIDINTDRYLNFVHWWITSRHISHIQACVLCIDSVHELSSNEYELAFENCS